MNPSRLYRLLPAFALALVLAAPAGAQQTATPRVQPPGIEAPEGETIPAVAEDATPLTRAIGVRLEKPVIAKGEPLCLILVMNAKPSYRERWPDFLGGQAHLKVRLVDGAGRKSPFFWIDQDSMYGALRPQDFKEPTSRLRAVRVPKEDTLEIHLWLGPEQLPVTDAGDYKVEVVSSRGGNPAPPWYGPEGQRSTAINVHQDPSKQESLPEPKQAAPKRTEPEESDAATAPRAPTVILALSVKDDGKELTKVAEALRRKITNDGMRGSSRHEAEIQSLFSLSGPEARRVQEGLMDEIGDDPWGGAAVYKVIDRMGSPRIIEFIENQCWNKGRRVAVDDLLLMHYFGRPEARKQIEEIFRKHGEPIRPPMWNW